MACTSICAGTLVEWPLSEREHLDANLNKTEVEYKKKLG
jgi:hypothetical protein